MGKPRVLIALDTSWDACFAILKSARGTKTGSELVLMAAVLSEWGTWCLSGGRRICARWGENARGSLKTNLFEGAF